MKLIGKIKDYILSNAYTRSISILAAGTAFSHMLIFITTPILTRLYTPEEFGVFSIYLSILYSISVISALMYDLAIPLPEDDREAWHIFILALIMVVIFSTAVFIATSILPIGKWVNSPAIDHYGWLLSFSILGIGWYQVYNSWNNRDEDYKAISRSKINMNSGQMLAQIGLGLFHPGLIGLLAGEVTGRISGTLTFMSFFKKRKRKVHKVTLAGLKGVMKRYKKFPLISSWSVLINNTGFQIPTLFIAAQYGPKAAGFYLLAQKIFTVPEALLGYSVQQVYYSKSAKLSRGTHQEFSDLFWQTVKKMGLISGIIIGIISFIVPFVIPLLFGAEWKESGSYLQCMNVLYFIRMVVNPISGNFYALESQSYQIAGEICRFSIIILSMVVCYFYIQSPAAAILCISLMSTLGYLIYGSSSWFAMKMYFKKPANSGSNV